VVVEEVRKEDFNAQVEAMGILRDPIRRSLYRHVAEQPEAVSRDAVARAVGISRVRAAAAVSRSKWRLRLRPKGDQADEK
jgi:ribosomal protein S3